MTQRASIISHLESAPARELYFFTLYRALEAGILAGLLFSPLSDVLGELRAPTLGTVVTAFYLVFAVLMLLMGRKARWLVPLVLVGTGVDILVAALITYALPQATAGIAMLLLFNVAAAALLLPFRWGMLVTAVAPLVMAVEFFISLTSTGRSVA